MKKNKYVIEKDTIVEVYKVFGNEQYFAIAEINGRYPQPGKIAHDINRQEYIYVLTGEILVSINGQQHSLKPEDTCLIKEDDKYYIQGTGKVLVFVKDGEDGTSKLEPS
ncbi:MAG TPA: hypothetical protein VK338_03630 [Candidatus Nitrosocosmicus sp.]|nr:hypothetical protein [Candidatus Nitrosocosmicus sp.]